MKSLYLGHQNLIQSFIDFFEYIIYDNEPIGDGWMKINNDNLNDFCMKYYYDFRRWREDGLVKPRPNWITSTYKPYSSVENLKIPIKSDPITAKFDMATTFFNGTKKIISVPTENNFSRLAHTIIINKDQGIKEGLEISMVYPSYEPNTMGYHRNTLIYSDEGRSKVSNTNHTKNIRLVNSEEKLSTMHKL